MIPLATTTVSVLRLPEGTGYDEPYGGPEPGSRTAVTSGLRAVIDYPSGTIQVAGGVQAIEEYRLIADPAPVDYRDLIRDEGTGRVYRITWLIAYPASVAPDDHIEAGLRSVEGET